MLAKRYPRRLHHLTLNGRRRPSMFRHNVVIDIRFALVNLDVDEALVRDILKEAAHISLMPADSGFVINGLSNQRSRGWIISRDATQRGTTSDNPIVLVSSAGLHMACSLIAIFDRCCRLCRLEPKVNSALKMALPLLNLLESSFRFEIPGACAAIAALTRSKRTEVSSSSRFRDSWWSPCHVTSKEARDGQLVRSAATSIPCVQQSCNCRVLSCGHRIPILGWFNSRHEGGKSVQSCVTGGAF